MKSKSVQVLVALLFGLIFTASSCPSNMDQQDTEQNRKNWERIQDRVESGSVITADPEGQLAFETFVDTSTELAVQMEADAEETGDAPAEEAPAEEEEPTDG